MKSMQTLSSVSDDDLLRRLAALVHDSRHTEADLVAHVGEVDARRLYAREAVPSMFHYCTERLHLSGAEAYLRIAAARAAREHPVLLDMLADGRLHLTAIALLAPVLTPQNRDALLRRATHRTKREIEELLAEFAPRPDAPALIRKLPEPWASVVARIASPTTSAAPSALVPPAESASAMSTPRSGTRVPAAPTRDESDIAVPSLPELRPDGVVSTRLGGMGARPSRIEPLAPARYKVQFTASAELREKLERLRDLMRSSVPDGDLAAIVDAAVTEKLERLERRRFGRTRAPRKALTQAETSPSSRHVPAPVRRAVHERDEGRCRYVDREGRQCTARVGLEFHQRRPYGLGGDHSLANVALLCHQHNRHLAQVDYGRSVMARQGRPGRTTSG
jgi:5-methylcytosine-specific restriction endonuclease McrA